MSQTTLRRVGAAPALAAAFADIAPSMIIGGSVAQTQAQIVRLAVDSIHGCDAADVMVLDSKHRLRTAAYSSSSVYLAGLIQRHNRSGPSGTSLRLGSCVVDDFSTDQRWPRLSAWASSNGMASTCALPMTTDRRTVGVLNVYSARVDNFTESLVTHVEAFATHAALAIESVSFQCELSAALLGQRLIGEAVGILMERHGLTADSALERSLAASRILNITVLELAARIVQTGAEAMLPGTPLTSSAVSQDFVSRYATGVAST